MSDSEDGTDNLCHALYGRAALPADYLGGSQAKMLHDAAAKLARLAQFEALAKEAAEWMREMARKGTPYAATNKHTHRLAALAQKEAM